MAKRAPLLELPLEKFHPSSSKRPISPFKPSHKRAISSLGTPSLFSPSKRRILAEEGLFSPSNSFQSPFSPSRVGSASKAASHLRGPDSPARRLDFGVSKNDSQETAIGTSRSSSLATVVATPPRSNSPSSISKPLAPSPELLSATASRACSSSSVHASVSDSALPAQRSTHIPTYIPRERPPSPDRSSPDYPGFDVHADTHIRLLHVSDLRRSSSPPSETDDESESDAAKENVAPPRKKARRMSLSGEGEMKPPGAIPLHGHATPVRGHIKQLSCSSATPRQSSLLAASSMALSGPASSPAEKAMRRRAMVEELDDVASGDEEDSEGH